MATSLLRSSEETSFCDACQVVDNVTSVAVYYCEDCLHELCNNCHEYHRKTLATRKHKVTNLQDIKGKESDFQVSGRRPNFGTTRTTPDVQVSGRRPNEGAATATPDLQVSGRRPNDGAAKATSNLQVSGRRPNFGTTRTTPDLQVSGRRPNDGAAKAKKGTGEDQSTDITRKVQHVSISPRLDSKSTTDRAETVYKTATLKKGLNVSVESDAGMCDIMGIVLLQDRLIVCDYANFKLKVFGSDYTFQFEYTCYKKPSDIDMLDTTTVVVSYHSSMKVLSVGSDSMTELVNVNTQYSCYGVCCHDGKIYCVVGKKKVSEAYSEVRVYSPDGTLKRKFDYLSDGRVDFNNITYITVNPQTGILYVTDFKKGVLALSTNGDVIDVMSPPQLKSPEGIAFDEHGQIYVCGCASNNVIRMTADGGDAEEILANNPRCKLAMCVKIYGNNMYLGRRESGTVFVYELS